MKTTLALSVVTLNALIVLAVEQADLPIVDISGETDRHVIIAQGAEKVYHGHPTTLLMPDGKTMFCVWTYGHGGGCGPMKRSDDGGLTWSELLPVPENWARVRNCPAIYRLTDPQGKARLFVFAGQGPGGTMQQSVSTDDGKTWSPMTSNGLVCVMPFCTIVPVEGGKKLIGLTNIRRPGETKEKRTNVIAQSESTDGGLTWSPWRIILDLGKLKPCEPEVVRSPDGKQLLCLLRENVPTSPGHYMTSEDEGRTWSPVKDLPPGLRGDRHKAVYAKDGRLVVCFRDMGTNSPTQGHFVAWVGRYEDIVAGRDGQYKIKLLHNYKGKDCGYPGVEVLPDATIVATTYVKYRPGPELNSVVSVRFRLEETDKAVKQTKVAPASKVTGPVLDDAKATFTGSWAVSARFDSLVNDGYRHDDRVKKQPAAATFVPEIPADGRYEVRLLYVAASNRATNTAVTIRSADGEKTVFVNQRQPCLEDGNPRALGVFTFAKGKSDSVQISNAGANGYVVVDGLQLVPESAAQAERAAKSGAGFPVKIHRPPPQVKIPPPILLESAAKPQDVDGKSYDLVVIGGTPGGIACAVRAAREGLSVLLTQHNRHIGGMLANGLMQWDALYGGPRAPIFNQYAKMIEGHYRKTYGENSPQYRQARYTQEHYPMSRFEPSVAEREFNRLVAAEKNITLLLGHYPSAVERNGALLRSVTLREYGGTKEIRVRAAMFADATYEGDLAALAKVPYRVGREGRDEYGEPHAGKIFTNIKSARGPRDAIEGRLNLRPYGHVQGSIDPNSPQTADRAIQAYNYRFCLTNEERNRCLLDRPPPGYNREEYVNFNRKGMNAGALNGKSSWNAPILPVENHAYPEATWPEREKIIERHKNFALGLMWFLQNDESVRPGSRAHYRQIGLALDEYPDNNNIPYEMYVREARRIVGRYVYREQDNSLAPGLGRAPIQPDSIAFTDWPMDSHECTTDRRPGYDFDGKLILAEESRPGQIPYRALLPQDVDNLLVPVCLSATHVAWGAVRLEPVFMQTGEAAGFAAALAKKHGVTPAALDANLLVRTLCKAGCVVTFFNEREAIQDPAAQYFGTKGFFHDYNARLNEPLKPATAKLWNDTTLAPNARARAIAEAEKIAGTEPLTRGAVLQSMWESLK